MCGTPFMCADPTFNDNARGIDRLSDEELLAWLRIARVYRGRVREALQLVAAFELPEAIFETPRSRVKEKIGREAAMALFDVEAEEAAQRALCWLRRTATADAVLLTDDDYPRELIESGTGDVLYFIRGRRLTLKRPRVTLLITSKADAEGRRNLEEFSAALARRGVACVLSMENEAEKAGAAALETAGGAFIVSASGPDRVPAACLDVWRRAEKSGLIFTGEFPGTSAAEAGREPRNHLLAALSRGILVIESERRDPVLEVTRLAAELGRDVAAVPGSIHSRTYKGNHLLIRQGAKLTECLDDIVKDFRLEDD